MMKAQTSISNFETTLNSTQVLSKDNMKDIKAGESLAYEFGYWLGTKAREAWDWLNG